MDRRRIVAGAYALTALTGASGLIYQIAWQRYLARLLGSDSLATATVLGVFLGGLSAGFLLWGFVSERTDRPLRAYGWLEGVIGAWGLAFPWLFAGIERATADWSFAPPVGLVLEGTLCAAALITVPTLCMGATVPLLTRALAASIERATPVHARVYAANTAGALVGALLAGFVAVRLLGLPATVRVAALSNLGAAVFFLLASRAGIARPRNEPEARPARVVRPGLRPRARFRLLAIGLLAGFAFMTLESLVIRLANLSLGPSLHGLSVVIAAFLLCLALGAFLAGRRRSWPRGALLVNQTLASVSLVPVFLTVDDWPYLAHLLRIQFGFEPIDFALYHLAVLGGLSFLLVVPVGCMGATLPLVFDALKAGGGIGRTAGALFAWNALGNLLGGIFGGFWIYHWLGVGEVYVFAAVLLAATALLAAVGSTGWRRPALAAAAAGGVAVLITLPSHDPLRFAVGTFHLHEAVDYSRDGPAAFYEAFHAGRTVLAYRDDPEATLAVVENPRLLEALRTRFPSLTRSIVAVPSALDAAGPRPRSIMINGKADSSTFYDRETLRLAAHLPALLAERRERVLVVGLGTGVTAGELALYPDVRVLDVAEIAPGVAEMLPLFGEWTHAVHLDPRLTIHVGDAFRLLRRSGSRWDVVVSQPSNPWMSGVDQLFSREFYRLVRESLEPDGLFLCWMQRYSTNRAIERVILDTLRSEFPHVRIFRTGSDDLLLASRHPLPPDRFVRAQTLLDRHPRVARSLADVRVGTIGDLLARERPGAFAPDEPSRLETLDRPRIHFLSGLAFFGGDDLDAQAGGVPQQPATLR